MYCTNKRSIIINAQNNTYNIDREFDYHTIKAIMIQSLKKIVKEEH
jgi:hypothetical protein